MMIDSYKHKGQREALVQSLIAKGICKSSVLAALKKIPRHFFMESAFWDHAYDDKPFSIGLGQTISQPYTVARQTELLDVKKDCKILEIGTGSGYQAAILSALGAKVYSIEFHEELSQRAQMVLSQMGLEAQLYVGDGSQGLAEFAPYDRILVTAGAKSLPRKLLEQLKIGGILVIPVGEKQSQNMLRITRNSETQFRQETFGEFAFVPLVGSY
jgi:protein-L-isoaspartate(D-aspartate) O-methyltransferase